MFKEVQIIMYNVKKVLLTISNYKIIIKYDSLFN
jgi:hypothetical protein